MSQRDKPQDNKRDQDWIDLVKKHGHAVMRVADLADKPSGEPGFAYSTGGYESYGAPEVIVTGLDGDLMHSMVNTFFEEWRNGKQFQTETEYDGFLEGFPVVFMECGTRAVDDYATWTDWYYEREPFPLWQMIWPGSACGLFPWDIGCPDEVIEMQPDLTNNGYASLKASKH